MVGGFEGILQGSTPEMNEALDDFGPGQRDLDGLVQTLATLDGEVDRAGAWPEPLWRTLVDAGVTRWALPPEFGGEPLDRSTLLARYARVAEGSLTAAFILSQHDAGVRRLAMGMDRPVARGWLGKIAEGQAFATVGLSQLTTSKRHGDQAVRAEELGDGRFRIDGLVPWVTAAHRADFLVLGASTDDGRQLLVALPSDRAGVSVRPPFALAALQASCTAEIACDRVEVAPDEILIGPTPNVMASPSASGTGGLETSTLALGLALAAIRGLDAEGRDNLAEPAEALRSEWQTLWRDLLATAVEAPGSQTSAAIRGQSNALALRATQAYLTARKGSGFLLEDPAQRWARQALFFLVWSCPSPVANAALRDLAGLCALA